MTARVIAAALVWFVSAILVGIIVGTYMDRR